MSMIITLFLGLINFAAQCTRDVPTTLYLFFDEEDDLMEKRVLDGIPYFYFYDEILKKKKEAASEGGELSLEDLPWINSSEQIRISGNISYEKNNGLKTCID